jgi:hypothetical protein
MRLCLGRYVLYALTYVYLDMCICMTESACKHTCLYVHLRIQAVCPCMCRCVNKHVQLTVQC